MTSPPIVLELTANIGSAAVSRNPQPAVSTIPSVKQKCHSCKWNIF